jgi:hypothetical protein
MEVPESYAEWKKRFDAFIASLEPGNLHVDDSRESIYGERCDQILGIAKSDTSCDASMPLEGRRSNEVRQRLLNEFIAGLEPGNPNFDDSRESIYGEREDQTPRDE